MRLAVTVAYDGSDFKGWALQKAERTVQGSLTEAVRLIVGEDIEIFGSSRTDSGAHAKGQVAHFDVPHGPPLGKWPEVLNKRLPPDIRVLRIRETKPDFHARFSTRSRFYRYRIAVADVDPFRARQVHGYGEPLDLEKMQAAAALLVGYHDFRAYTEELDPTVENTWRRLFSVDVRQVRNEVWVDVVGTAFLRGMMRRMAGALLETGRGYRPVVEVSRLLDPEERRNVHPPVVLPAKGLCLMRVTFGRRLLDHRTTSLDHFPLPVATPDEARPSAP